MRISEHAARNVSHKKAKTENYMFKDLIWNEKVWAMTTLFKNRYWGMSSLDKTKNHLERF